MSEITTVYAVSRGEYSDYWVLCICDSKETADAVAAAENEGSRWGEARVEEFLCVHGPPEKIRTLQISQELFDDGTEGKQNVRDERRWPWSGWRAPWPDCEWRWVRAPVHNGKGGRLTVWGTDIERCRKVFTEKKRAIRTTDALRTQREATGGGRRTTAREDG